MRFLVVYPLKSCTDRQPEVARCLASLLPLVVLKPQQQKSGLSSMTGRPNEYSATSLLWNSCTCTDIAYTQHHLCY